MATAPVSRKLNLTRDQLANFLSDQQQIKQFELLFAAVDEIQVIVETDFEYQADTAAANANNALAQISALAQALDLLAVAPRSELGTIAPQNSDNVNITGGLISGLDAPLPIASGGTNSTANPTAYGVSYGTGTAYAFTAAGTTKQALLANTGAAPTWATLTTGASILYGDGSGGFSNVTIGTGVSFVGGTLSATGSGGTVTAVTGSGNIASSGGATPNITFTGTLPIANGGTNGSAAPTAGAVPYGTGTAYAFTAAGTTGQVLTSNGAGAPTWATNAGGDVTGPASSTDNAIARFDGTTGKLIQNSVTTIDDTGNASGILSQQFSNGAAVTLAAGKFWYDGSTGAWNLGMGNGNITQQIGEEIFVYGKASAAITDSPLQIIRHTGVVGASGVIQFAPTVAGITDPNAIIGIATESLAHNGFGRATVFGVVRGITTNGTAFGETWADDDVIWYNPVTGNPTKVEPVAPYIKVQVGLVIKAGAGGSGSFQVNIARGSKLGGTDSNVQFGTLANANLIQYSTALGYWTNVTPSSVIGVGSVANAVTFNNGGAGAASGTTFDGSVARTISYNTIGAQPSGTYVTSVTGTAPVVSSGGTTPAISMAAANGSTNGYLTSTDWTTFNNKGSGSVTSVAATVPSVLSISGSPITTSGTLAIGYSGTALPVANGGTGLTSVPHTVTIYTSGSGTYTTPANCKALYIRMVGGGGNGGGSTGITAGGGGGAGGYLEAIISSPAASYTYAVGAAGGNTTFNGSTYSANAGAAGTSSSAAAFGGAGGTAAGGNLNMSGADGGFGWASPPYYSGGYGAGSPFGSGGSGGGTGFGNGFNGVVFGSGGGGAVGGGGAGSGFAGLIVITEVYV